MYHSGLVKYVNTVTTVVTKNKHVHFQNFVFPILFPIDFEILTFSLFDKNINLL